MPQCNYCGKTDIGSRDDLVDLGWSFVDLRAPVRKYYTACPKCIETDERNEEFQQTMPEFCREMRFGN